MNNEYLYKKIDELLSLEDTLSAKKYLNKIKNKDGIYYYFCGEIKRMEGLLKDSFDYYLKALKNLDKKSIFYQRTLLRLISILRSKGNIKEVEKYIGILNKINPRDWDFVLEKAMCLRMKGNFNKALYYFSKLKKKYLNDKDFAGISYIYWAVGGIFRLKGDFKKSILNFKNAIKYSIKAKDRSLLLYSKFGLAGVLRIAGKVKESYKEYSQCLKLIDKNDYFSKAYYYCGTANALRQMGDYHKAIKNYLISYRYYKKTGDNLDLALVLWGLGNAYMKVGRIKLAEGCFLKANKFFEEGFEPRGNILNLFSLSYIYYINGKVSKAEKIYFKAINEAKRNNLKTYLEFFT